MSCANSLTCVHQWLLLVHKNCPLNEIKRNSRRWRFVSRTSKNFVLFCLSAFRPAEMFVPNDTLSSNTYIFELATRSNQFVAFSYNSIKYAAGVFGTQIKIITTNKNWIKTKNINKIQRDEILTNEMKNENKCQRRRHRHRRLHWKKLQLTVFHSL